MLFTTNKFLSNQICKKPSRTLNNKMMVSIKTITNKGVL